MNASHISHPCFWKRDRLEGKHGSAMSSIDIKLLSFLVHPDSFPSVQLCVFDLSIISKVEFNSNR